MIIHFFVNTSFPHGMAAARRRLCYAKGLMSAGDTVLVHCTHRVFNQGEDDGFPEQGEYQGIPYNYISGKYKHNSKILRGLDWSFLDCIRTFFYGLKNVKKQDALYLYLYPVFLQVLLLIVAKVRGAVVVKETCEHPAAVLGRHGLSNSICRWFEFNFIMPLYDGFIPISRELDKFIKKYKSQSARSLIVPILVEENAFEVDFHQIKCPYSVPYIIHTGTMQEAKDGISQILKAFARYKREHNSNLRLVFTGPHANVNCSYLPLIRELGIEDSVDLLGLVSVDQIAVLQHNASLTVIYKNDNLQARNCFSTKLGEMLICGVPVITTSIGESTLYLQDEVNAIIIEPNDEDKLVASIHRLLSDSEFAHKIGSHGRDVARKYFNPIYQGERLHSFFNQLKERR